MSYFIGFMVAAAVAALGYGTGFDRSRNFYPLILIVSASYYTLFAALGGSSAALAAEALAFAVFTVVAVLGFRWSRWLAIGGLLAHAGFDALHALIVDTPGLPRDWPAFCLAFDIALAACAAFAKPPTALGCPAATDPIQPGAQTTSDLFPNGHEKAPPGSTASSLCQGRERHR